MKKLLRSAVLVGLVILLVSWHDAGHRAIGQIAANHLTPEAQTAVKKLLGHESLADVATWADEVKSDQQYRQTASWHFLNLPVGLSYGDFVKEIQGKTEGNIYSAIVRSVAVLQSNNSGRVQKIIALKFLVHLVGDAHQPMHVSRAEDRGGNNIAVKYNGENTDLHALWDGNMISHEGLNYMQMAAKYDTATPAQIKKWQSDSIMIWLWESYQISSQLYTEIEENNNIGEDYYQSHMLLVQQRVEKAGIRLAGVLNMLFTPQGTSAATDSLKHQ